MDIFEHYRVISQMMNTDTSIKTTVSSKLIGDPDLIWQ